MRIVGFSERTRYHSPFKGFPRTSTIIIFYVDVPVREEGASGQDSTRWCAKFNKL